MAMEQQGQHRVVLEPTGLQALLDALKKQGYQIVGPAVHDHAIVLDTIQSMEELPAGWGDKQEGGFYRIREQGDGRFFAYASPQQSWKNFLFPSVQRLWQARRTDRETPYQIEPESEDSPPLAFLGVRPCDLRAIEIQDMILLEGPHADSHYARRRERAFLVVVQCGEPCGTCFCASMGTGPRAAEGFDLALTEVLDAGSHRFICEVGSERGEAVLGLVPQREATEAEWQAALAITGTARGRMGRTLDTFGIRELFYRNYEHPRWEETPRRCLTCTNCTLVCPTCFCNNIEDTTDLQGRRAERWRRLDSCFAQEFSYVHGGSIRASDSSRYRQWIHHKLATWIDQFGMSGCVGCGRCITWCPVGIDITEEARVLRETEHRRKETVDGGD